MSDPTTERMMELQSSLRIRLAELGFTGVQASNLVHHLSGIAAIAEDLATRTLPLLLEISPAHHDALANVAAHLKRDLDELRDSIQDMEPDFTELLKFLANRTR